VKIAGIDVGSTTVKAVLVADDEIVWRDYRRHGTRQAEAVLDFLDRMEAQCGLRPGRDRVLCTGSGAGSSRLCWAASSSKKSCRWRRRWRNCIPM
jgi:activator of 2-hydroxyglutaryl-CoA dehydratase